MALTCNKFYLVAIMIAAIVSAALPVYAQQGIEDFDLFAKPTATPLPTTAPSVTGSTPLPTISAQASSRQSMSAEEDERAIPVTAVGVLFEADGSETSKIIMANYFKVLQQHKFNPGRAFAIVDAKDAAVKLNELQAIAEPIINEGIPDLPELPENEIEAAPILEKMAKENLGTPQFLHRLAMGLSIVPVPQKPTAYEHVKSLPTWMLYTADGQILLEGLMDPSSLLTASGKFVEPLGASEVK